MKKKLYILLFLLALCFMPAIVVQAEEIPKPEITSVKRITSTTIEVNYKLDNCNLNKCGIVVINKNWVYKNPKAMQLRGKNTTSAPFTDLNKNETYEFYVQVYWFEGDLYKTGKPVGPVSEGETTSSKGLSKITTTLQNYETVKIGYTAGSDVKSVKVTNLSVSPNKTVNDSKKTGVTFDKLTPDKSYKFKITPILADGKEGTSTTKTVSLNIGKATFNSLTKYGYNKLKMAFTRPAASTGIQVENMTTKKKTYYQYKNTVALSGLDYNKSYKFRIRSYYKASGGKYYYGPWTSSKTNIVKLVAPANFTVTSTTPGKATLQYKLEDPSTGVEVYNSVTGTTKKYAYKSKISLGSLTKGKTYKFKIRTYYKTSSGKYYYSYYTDLKSVKIASRTTKPTEPTTPSGTVDTTLPIPTSITVSRADYNKIKVGYTISDPSKVDGVEIYNITSGVTRTGITNKTYYDYDKLTYDKAYTFKVRTYKTVNSVKKYSNWSTTSKEIVAKLPTIPNLTAENLGDGKVRFKYTPTGTVSGVEIQDITNSKENGPKKTTTYKSQVVWSNLTSGLHKFRIRSYYTSGSKTYYSYWSTSFTNQSDGISVAVTGGTSKKVTCSIAVTNGNNESIKWCTTTSSITVKGTCTSSTSTISASDIHISCGTDKCITSSSIKKTSGKTATVTGKILNTDDKKDKKRYGISVYATDGVSTKGSISRTVGFKNCNEVRNENWG